MTCAREIAQAEGFGEKGVLDYMADKGREDLYFLLTRLLNRGDIERDWLYERCREVQADPDGRLDLWARDHYKSTIITFGLTIQDLLKDPELTVGIFSHTQPVARSFLAQIMNEFERNDLLKRVYPDVLWDNPRSEAPRWSVERGIVLRRKRNPKEGSVEAWGLVDGQPTGRHFGLMVYDDVVTRESVATPEAILRVAEAWELSLNLSTAKGRVRYVGTRYHHNDVYRTIMDREAARPRIHAATADGSPQGEPVLLDRESLGEKRRSMGPYTFSCQMLQNPLSDETRVFQAKWLRRWRPEGDADSPRPWEAMNRYILVDPASSKKRGSDYTVMLVMGLNKDRNYYLIDAVRDRLNLTERARALFRLHREYSPLAVGYERYGQQADIEHIQERMERENRRFTIIPLGGRSSKSDRVGKLVPLFERGRIYLPRRIPFVDAGARARDLAAEFVEEEYLAFPLGAHDDMLDAMARVVDPDLGAVFPLEGGPARGGRAIMEYDLFNANRGDPGGGDDSF